MNYLTYQIQPLAKRQERDNLNKWGEVTRKRKPHKGKYRLQSDVARQYGIPARYIRRAIESGWIDYIYRSDGRRMVVFNERTRVWCFNTRIKMLSGELFS